MVYEIMTDNNEIDLVKYIDMRFTAIAEKIDSLSATVNQSYAYFQRTIESHDNRIRAQGEQIAKLTSDIANANTDVAKLQMKVEAIENSQTHLWRDLLLDGVKFFLFGGGLTGATYFILRALGQIK